MTSAAETVSQWAAPSVTASAVLSAARSGAVKVAPMAGLRAGWWVVQSAVLSGERRVDTSGGLTADLRAASRVEHWADEKESKRADQTVSPMVDTLGCCWAGLTVPLTAGWSDRSLVARTGLQRVATTVEQTVTMQAAQRGEQLVSWSAADLAATRAAMKAGLSERPSVACWAAMSALRAAVEKVALMAVRLAAGRADKTVAQRAVELAHCLAAH